MASDSHQYYVVSALLTWTLKLDLRHRMMYVELNCLAMGQIAWQCPDDTVLRDWFSEQVCGSSGSSCELHARCVGRTIYMLCLTMHRRYICCAILWYIHMVHKLHMLHMLHVLHVRHILARLNWGSSSRQTFLFRIFGSTYA